MDERLEALARTLKGFMPESEGRALFRAALAAPQDMPYVEVGSYCGKSTIYLGAAARSTGSLLFTIDHHRGSEEHQPGEAFHDPDLVSDTGVVDTLPQLRNNIARAGIEDTVVIMVGDSATIASNWSTPLGFAFIDGGHSSEAASADYEGWAPHVAPTGILAIHDVFEDPAEGGRPPFEIYSRAMQSGAFREVAREGSLRVLRRVSDGL
jgi:predicted O-methyltransferase YrrM